MRKFSNLQMLLTIYLKILQKIYKSAVSESFMKFIRNFEIYFFSSCLSTKFSLVFYGFLQLKIFKIRSGTRFWKNIYEFQPIYALGIYGLIRPLEFKKKGLLRRFWAYTYGKIRRATVARSSRAKVAKSLSIVEFLRWLWSRFK